jgi:sigma-B regulation protein RsbU (phosphoserine phosphatase)
MYSELAIKERLNKEVLIASNIQKNLLPKEVKIPFQLETAEYFEPAKEIGGDYYDYNITSDNQIFITIGDVSGKGVPASLVMTTIRAVLKTLSYTQEAPAEMLTTLNRFMCRDMSDEMFVTIFHSRYDNKTKTLTYSNAGHNPLIIYKASEDRVFEKNVKGPAIGFLEDYSYKEGKIELDSKDVLVYYTDGITECENSQKDMFGVERLKEIIYENRKESSERIKETILLEIKKFRDGHDQLDDITLIVVKI